MLKIVVIGYGQMFANLISGCLESGHKVVGVLRHDKVIYDKVSLKIKDIFAPSNDKSFIDSLKLYEINANSVNSEEFKKEIIKLNPDIILVGSWSEKLKKTTIDLPKMACINCHPSMLPKYRGPNPYAQVIINGEEKTGITFHLMDSNFDTGAILHQAEVDILPNDTGETLKSRCANTAKKEIAVLLNNLETEIIIPIPQNESAATYQKQLDAHDIILDFKKTSDEIDRKIRGLRPWLNCYIPYQNVFFKVDKYKIIDKDTKKIEPETIVKKGRNSLQIVCGDNKTIEFSNLKILGTAFFGTSIFINLFVKTNSKAN